MVDDAGIEDGRSAPGRSAGFPIGSRITIEQLAQDPRPALAALQASEPVSWVPALQTWLVTDRELVIEAMRDAERFTVDDERFTTAAVLGQSMLSLDGPEHERHRGPFAEAFRPGILRERFADFLRAEVGGLIDSLDSAGAELRSGLAGPLAVNTITRLLGLDGVVADDVLGWYRSISKAITDLTTGSVVADEDRAAVAEIHGRVRSTLDSPTTASLLATIQASGALRPDEMGGAAAVLMFGAIETAEGMTANALWHLSTTNGAWSAVGRDRSLLANAIEESLRLEPAAAVVDRYATVDVELGPVTIPAGEPVTLSLLAANHDPSLFESPTSFDLYRPNAHQHVSFVQGPHACLGLHLARMETAAAIEGLLDVAPEVDVDHARSSRPAGLIFRKPAALSVRWS